MGFTIDDGQGLGRSVGVTANNRLKTVANTNLRGYYVSRDDQRAFNINSVVGTASSGLVYLYFQNTSPTRDFNVDLVRVSSAQGAMWKLWTVTGTASGTTASPTNLNLKSGVTAESNVFASASVAGLTFNKLIANVRTAASTSATVPFDDMLILGVDNSFAIEYDTGVAGDIEILVRGYYEDSP